MSLPAKLEQKCALLKDADSNTYSIDISSLRSIQPCAGLQKGESPFMFGKKWRLVKCIESSAVDFERQAL